jgi:hypothetical protein
MLRNVLQHVAEPYPREFALQTGKTAPTKAPAADL